MIIVPIVIENDVGHKDRRDKSNIQKTDVDIRPWEAGEFEYPPGHFMLCNDWSLDLIADKS